MFNHILNQQIADAMRNERYQTIDYVRKGIAFPGARINNYELTDSYQ